MFANLNNSKNYRTKKVKPKINSRCKIRNTLSESIFQMFCEMSSLKIVLITNYNISWRTIINQRILDNCFVLS